MILSVFKSIAKRVDWILVGAVAFILVAGLVTMSSFVGQTHLFERQLIWIVLSFFVLCGLSLFDYRFLRKPEVVVSIFGGITFLLLLIFLIGKTLHGAQSWLMIGPFSVQPAELAKLVLVILLAKYFSRRHVEITHIRHILISGLYTFILFLLIFLQPDFGSAIIIFFIWTGMILVSGISKKHLLALILICIVSFAGLWNFAFENYQKQRILTFLHPLTNLQGSGYNTYQSTIAVGSGEIWGKGIGYGTQSRLQFLPEYESDFIFAAFAEEWGFAGVLLLFAAFGIVIWRILYVSMYGATNFEMLFGIGIAVLFMSQFLVHVGVNLGLLPVTGTTFPFMSYGGSHLVVEFAALGMLMGMRSYARPVHKQDTQKEFLGL